MNEHIKGFTLIEVMVTVLIISVGMLATASLLITSIKTNGVSERRMDASALAQSVLSGISVNAATAGYLQATAITDAQSLLGDAYDSGGLDGGYNPTVTITPTPTVTKEFSSIIITLTWSDRGTDKLVEIRSGVVAN